MKVISFCKNKCKVGSTTSVFNISAALANMRYKVLMIDFDYRASLTKMCSSKDITVEEANDVLIGNKSIDDCIKKTNINNLYLLPSNCRHSIATELIDGNETPNINALSNAITHINMYFDFVIIDNEPGIGVLPMNSLVASDYVVFVVRGNPLANDNIEFAGEVYLASQDYNSKLNNLGILNTHYKSDDVQPLNEYEVLDTLWCYGGFVGEIVDIDKAKKATYKGIPVVIKSPHHYLSTRFRVAASNIVYQVDQDYAESACIEYEPDYSVDDFLPY